LTTEQASNRNPDGTFKKGFSGNPGGRPKIAKYINEKTSNLTQVIDEVYKIFLNPPDQKAFQWAVDYLTNRSVGTPTQHQQIEDITPEPIEYILVEEDEEKTSH